MAAPRLYVELPGAEGALAALHEGAALALPDGPARHVQVLRLQPGAPLTLFDGRGGEWAATVTRMGRSEVEVRVGAHRAVQRELPVAVTLALGMPANERMDFVVEKATELGVAAIQPLMCERSVLRLAGERAAKKVAHWQGVAIAASEQCGRTAVPRIEPVRGVADWLARLPPPDTDQRLLLSLRDAALLRGTGAPALLCLSGPEGGLTDAEEALARGRGFAPTTLGPRVLRADTAPLAVLAWAALSAL